LGALNTDTKYVFGCRVEVDDQQALVDQDNACAQAVENALRIVAGASVVAGTVDRAIA
jgi:hypothetical protein